MIGGCLLAAYSWGRRLQNIDVVHRHSCGGADVAGVGRRCVHGHWRCRVARLDVSHLSHATRCSGWSLSLWQHNALCTFVLCMYAQHAQMPSDSCRASCTEYLVAAQHATLRFRDIQAASGVAARADQTKEDDCEAVADGAHHGPCSGGTHDTIMQPVRTTAVGNIAACGLPIVCMTNITIS